MLAETAEEAVAIVVASRRLICRSIRHHPESVRDVITPAMLSCSLGSDILDDFRFSSSLIPATITNLPAYLGHDPHLFDNYNSMSYK